MKKFIFVLSIFILSSKISFSIIGPDIIVLRSNYNFSQKQYQSFVSTVTLKNIGNDSVRNFNVTDLYFSKDSIYNSNSIYGGFVSFTILAPNDSITLSIGGGANQYGINADSSYKYVIIKSDYSRQVSELNENNNTWVGKTCIQNAKVDLAVAGFTLDSHMLHIGDMLNVEVNLKNDGADNVHNTFYEFFLSPDPIFDNSDTKIGYLNYALFDWTNHFTGNTSLAIPKLDTPNKYYIFVRIDTQGQEITINDYKLNNNIVLLDTITITDKIVNTTLNFDDAFGATSWKEDGHIWKWDNTGHDRIENYSPHSGSSNGSANNSGNVNGNCSKLSTSCLYNINGLWIKTSSGFNFDHINILGYGANDNLVYTKSIIPMQYEGNWAYLNMNWASIKSMQFEYKVIDNTLPSSLWYDDMDYTYKVDTINKTGCDSLIINGRTYKASSTYTQKLLNSVGGDSVIVFNVLLKKSTHRTLSVSSCDSVVINGNTYKTSGLYTQTIKNKVGCDSIITLNLNVIKSTKSTINQTACDSLIINGHTYKASGIYTQTIKNKAGCDSIITLNLNVLKSTKSTINQTACDSQIINGHTYKTSGLYTQTIKNTAGCDSTITLNLTVLKSTKNTINRTVCDSLIINGHTYITSGSYSQTIANAVGCDSVITLNLNITNVDKSIVQSGSSFTSNANSASYQWVFCDNNYQPIINETNQEFQAKINGYYAVIISQGTCIDTSACNSISGLSIPDLKLLDLKLFPNPNNGNFVISSENGFSSANIKVYNTMGKVVFEKQNYSGFNSSFDINIEVAGIYFIEILQNNKISKLKMVKY